jgi:hypothetical protein
LRAHHLYRMVIRHVSELSDVVAPDNITYSFVGTRITLARLRAQLRIEQLASAVDERLRSRGCG